MKFWVYATSLRLFLFSWISLNLLHFLLPRKIIIIIIEIFLKVHIISKLMQESQLLARIWIFPAVYFACFDLIILIESLICEHLSKPWWETVSIFSVIAESILLNTSTVLATSSAFPTGFDSVQCRKGWCKNLYSCQAKFSFFFNSFSDLLQRSHQSGHWPWDLIYVLSLWIWCHLNSICRGYFGTCLQIYWLRHKRVLLYFFLIYIQWNLYYTLPSWWMV